MPICMTCGEKRDGGMTHEHKQGLKKHFHCAVCVLLDNKNFHWKSQKEEKEVFVFR